MDQNIVEHELRSLPGWELNGDAIKREFKFADFKAAFEFMTKAAGAAEELNHHPDWSNVYNRVDVILTTHDDGGVTEKDLELARRMNELAGE